MPPVGRGCVKTIDEDFVSAKEQDLVERGSTLANLFSMHHQNRILRIPICALTQPRPGARGVGGDRQRVLPTRYGHSMALKGAGQRLI
jgi:hypothetical protein